MPNTTFASRISASVLLATLAAGCAAAMGGGSADEQQKIAALSASDVGLCYPAPMPAIGGVNADVLTGLLMAARPGVMECLVDPKNRGQAEETRVTVKTTAGGGKLDHAVTGQNLSPAGQQCIKGALDRHFGAVEGFAAKVAETSSPTTGEDAVLHVVGTSPAVQLGQNEASDVTGAVRLAQSGWCDCYAEWKAAPPHPLKATLTIAQGQPPKATFEPATDPASQKVAACLAQKIAGLQLTTSSATLTVPYIFMFTHTGQAASLTDEPPEVQLRQLDGLHLQRAARSVIAGGARTSAAMAYDALGKKYNAAPDSVPVEDLTRGCNALLAADDAWIDAMTKQLEAEQQTLALVQQLKAQKPGYDKAEAKSKADVEATTKDLASAKQMKEGDTGACPKAAN